MASLHLCNTSTNLHQTQNKLPTTTASAPCASNITILFKCKPSKLCSLGLQSLPQRHARIINRIDKSLEPSVSSSTCTRESSLRIGILGLGAFGQFLAKAFQRRGHNVLATSRSDYSEYCQENGIEFFRNVNGLCEAQPDVVLVCSSILSTEDVVRGIPFHKLKSNTIIADVLSVKQFPKNLLLETVPSGFGVLCTHPMFGKFSGKNSWEGLRFVYDKVRITENSIQEQKCEQFLNIFQDEGCRMVEMSCEEHDLYAAESQFITHTIARILSNMNLESTPINTIGYETLMELTRNTVSHGSDLYDGLFLYNVNASKQIEKLERAFDTVKQSLFSKLRDKYRQQIEETVTAEKTSEYEASPSSQFLPISEKVLKDLSSFSMVPEQGNRDASVEQKNEVYHVPNVQSNSKSSKCTV